MVSIQELMQTCFLPQGTYRLQILSPKGVPAHQITFSLEGGIYSAVVTTEHETQKARNLRVNGNVISWEQMAGSYGDERFLYEMKIYPEGIMLGDSRRNDVPREESPESPVLAELIE